MLGRRGRQIAMDQNQHLQEKRYLQILAPPALAAMVINPKEFWQNRYNAWGILNKKLAQFEGAGWIGVAFEDRPVVIKALRYQATDFSKRINR